ncbi:hypothetical protein L6R46_00220 [Myxococcota bacterium]|nr:hypothetical protein [Myxococcota bacterium]
MPPEIALVDARLLREARLGEAPLSWRVWVAALVQQPAEAGFLVFCALSVIVSAGVDGPRQATVTGGFLLTYSGEAPADLEARVTHTLTQVIPDVWGPWREWTLSQLRSMGFHAPPFIPEHPLDVVLAQVRPRLERNGGRHDLDEGLL